jgi:hypothetical protein
MEEIEHVGHMINGPGWHYRAVFGPDGKIQLYDIFIADKWVGSRRTEKQVLEVLRNEGQIAPPPEGGPW